jgi:hypothetical protein
VDQEFECREVPDERNQQDEQGADDHRDQTHPGLPDGEPTTVGQEASEHGTDRDESDPDPLDEVGALAAKRLAAVVTTSPPTGHPQ